MEDSGEVSTNNDNNNNNKSIANPYLAVNNQARWRKAAAVPPDSSFELLLPVRQERRKETLEDSHHDLKLPAEPEKENNLSTTLDETKEEGPTNASNNTASTPLSTPNAGLAFWERLPSNNLTFGSAEILTVEECVKHKDLYRGRGVRVTGLLRRRGFVEQQEQELPQVTLELVHIETTAPSSARIPNKTPVKPSMHPTTPTTSKSSSSLSESMASSHRGPFKTPTTLMQNPLVRNQGNPPTNTLSSKRKRPWFASTNNNSNKKSPPLPPSRLLSRPSTTTTTPLPELFLLQVLVDPELPRLSELVPSETTKVTAWGTMLEDGSIQARFVNLVDAQMDMNLYVTALLRRRRWLYQRHHKQQQQQLQQLVQPAPAPSSPSGPIPPRSTEDPPGTKEEKVEGTILIQGCGPPPYEKLLE